MNEETWLYLAEHTDEDGIVEALSELPLGIPEVVVQTFDGILEPKDALLLLSIDGKVETYARNASNGDLRIFAELTKELANVLRIRGVNGIATELTNLESLATLRGRMKHLQEVAEARKGLELAYPILGQDPQAQSTAKQLEDGRMIGYATRDMIPLLTKNHKARKGGLPRPSGVLNDAKGTLTNLFDAAKAEPPSFDERNQEYLLLDPRTRTDFREVRREVQHYASQ